MHVTPARPRRRRIFRVGELEFDEARRELRVGGVRRALEAKPREVLHALLSRGGEIASKDELIAAVWGATRALGDTSLTTAVSKLRAVLGGARDAVELVHGIGYRIAGTIEIVMAAEAAQPAFTFAPGGSVPGRPQWRLEYPLGGSGRGDIWLARHQDTAERRVFKFADTSDRFDALRREAALWRTLSGALGARPDLVPVLEWNFTDRPYFLECAFGGVDLPTWTGSITWAALDLEARVALAAQAARTIAAAHGAGVLHGALTPAHILVTGDAGGFCVRVVGFGVGSLADPVAPEPGAEAARTASADIRALGKLLYNLVVGDLDRKLTAGWEDDVADPLLRQDIAAAAAGDPARRLHSAATLAERLETLEARRGALQQRTAERKAAALAAQQLERARARRPWRLASLCSLACGLALSIAFGARAIGDRNEARRQAALARSVNTFLTDDLLGRGNPAKSGKPDETLMEAAAAAEGQLTRRLTDQPLVSASIYLALGQVFDSRGAYEMARTDYRNAAAAFERAEGPASADVAIMALHEAQADAMAARNGSVARAVTLLHDAAPRLGSLGRRTAEGLAWYLAAGATVSLMNGDSEASRLQITAAARLADGIPDVFDAGTRMTLHEREAVALIRGGHWDAAEALLRRLRSEVDGERDRRPDQLLVDLNLGRVLLGRHAYAPAAAVFDRIYPGMVAVFGAGHRQTLMAMLERAQALVKLGRYDDAMSDQMAAFRLASDKQGLDAFFPFWALSDASEAACRKGDGSGGLALAIRAHDGALLAFGLGSGYAQYMATRVAFCHVILKQYSLAEESLRGIDLASTGRLDTSPEEFAATVALIHAEAALATGDRLRALSLLAVPRRVFGRADVDSYDMAWTNRLLLQAASNSTRL